MLSSAINSKDSIDTGAKHGSYSVKLHSEKYSTWYMKYGKHKISLLMPKCTDLRDGARPDSHVTALWTVHIVKNDIYFLPYRFTNINFCHFSVAIAFKICWRRVTRNFFMDNFDLFLLSKLTLLSILRSLAHINLLKLLWRKHFLKTIYRRSNCY